MLATDLLIITRIQIAVFLGNSAVADGMRTKEVMLRVMKGGFAPVLGVTWVTSPTIIIFAQTFFPREMRDFCSIQLPSKALSLTFSPSGVV